MPTHRTKAGVYGPGSYTDLDFTPLPEECERLLHYLACRQPGFTTDPFFLSKVSFHGHALPLIPGPLKSQALSAVSHSLVALAATEILSLRGVDPGPIRISTDHAGLYPATPTLVSISGRGPAALAEAGVAASHGADLEKDILKGSAMRYRSWAIYPTREEGVHYQVLGSLSPGRWLEAFGLKDDEGKGGMTRGEAYGLIGREMGRLSAAEVEVRNLEGGFCGQRCYTPEGWRGTEMGRSLARRPLVDVQAVKGDEGLPRVGFEGFGDGDRDRRPLKGVRVLEMARVIAGPALCAELAALGAEVIKVQSSELPDLQSLSMMLTVGKRTCTLDIKTEAGRAHLKKLMAEADVIVQAFRLGSLERKGFGPSAAFEMARKRGKGIVYVDLNCYGPDGYYAERPGFQQIADAASGCSYVMGKAYGTSPILPSLPIADMLCGTFGVVDVLLALRDRATKGGSYHAHVALTSVDTVQLEEEVGLYQPEVVRKIQETYKFKPITPDLMVAELLGVVREAWEENSSILRNEEYFVTFDESAFGDKHRILAPVVQFANEGTRLRWDSPPMPYCVEKDTDWKRAEDGSI